MQSATRWIFAIVAIAALIFGAWWSGRSPAVDCEAGSPGCGDHPPAGLAVRDSASVEIELSRSACFGTCPAYTLSVRGSGEVTFTGERFVQDSGTTRGSLEPGQLAALLQAFDRANYLGFADSYTPDSPACGDASTDHPSVWTAIRFDGKTKRVDHYTGCSDAPAALDALEQAIDSIVGTRRWLGGPR